MLTNRPFNPDGTWGQKTKTEYILDSHGNKTKTPAGNDEKAAATSNPEPAWRLGHALVITKLANGLSEDFDVYVAYAVRKQTPINGASVIVNWVTKITIFFINNDIIIPTVMAKSYADIYREALKEK